MIRNLQHGVARTGRNIQRRMRAARRGGRAIVLGAVIAAGAIVAGPTWAPEDGWRLVVEAPGTPTDESIALRLVDDFLADHHVRLRPELRRSIAIAVADQSRRHRIRPRLLLSVILSESSFRTDAVSNRGAVGLMQLLPSTAEAIAPEIEIEWDGATRLLDPHVNIALGAHYLSHLLDVFDGDLQLALAAYNMGPTNLRNRLTASDGETRTASFTSTYAARIVARL